MKKLPLILFATLLLFACSEAPEETVTIAENSGWATSHLKGMVQSFEETHYTPDSTGQIGAMDSCCIEVNVFDDMGYLASYSERDREGTVTRKTTFERLEGGKIKSAVRTENGKQVWTRTIVHDENGNTLYGEDRDSSGQVTYYYSDIEENEIGQALKGKMHSADSTFMGIWSRKYTDGMRTGSGWVDSTGIQINDYTGELNEDGWLAKMTIVKMGEDSTLTTSVETYTYDSIDDMGNWTQRTLYNEEGKATEVEKRTYTYFEKE